MLEADGRVRGVLAGFRHPLWVLGRPRPLFWIVDYLVDPTLGRGLGSLRLARHLYAHHRDEHLFAGLPLDTTWPVWQRAAETDGVHLVPGFGERVRPLRASYFARRGTGRAGRLLAPILPLLDRYARLPRGPRPPAGSRILPQERFDGRVDALFQDAVVAYPVITGRDAGYLNWRFTDCPKRDYAILAAEDGAGELSGYVVTWVREEAWGGLTGRIADLFCARDDTSTRRRLLVAAVERLRGEGCEAVRIRNPGPAELQRELLRAGFLRYPNAGETMVLFDRMGRDRPAGLLTAAANWYLTFDRSSELSDF